MIRWYCPSCTETKVTEQVFGQPVQTPLHECRGMALLAVPFVQDGIQAVHVAREREDYVAGELVRVNAEGRPIMSVETRRPDGSFDATVYAPTVQVRGESRGIARP